MKYIFLVILIVLGVFLYQKNKHTTVKDIDNNLTKEVKVEVDTNVKKQWERLFKYYESSLTKKCQGTTEDEIVKVEKEFNVTLPKEFSDSFRVCNERYVLNTSEKKGWFGEHDHYSLSKTYYGYYELIEINRDMRMYDEKWKDEWIAFYDYETWFYAILDTKTKQVYIKSATENEYIIWANSYEEWLKMAVDEVLEHGEIRLELIQRLMGIEE
jgi:hypothetical protein